MQTIGRFGLDALRARQMVLVLLVMQHVPAVASGVAMLDDLCSVL